MSEAIKNELIRQMEMQADDTTPSSIQRDKGLTWLEGWFDLDSAYSHAPVPDDSLAARIGELGNQIHNLGCENQGNEALASRLEELRTEAWSIARTAAQKTR